MSKILFLKDPKNTVYNCTFSQIGKNQVRLEFLEDVPLKNILMSGFNIVNEHNGHVQAKRTDYIYLYRTYENNERIVELCNNNVPWIATKRCVTFYSNFGGALNGECKQYVNDYSELDIPIPIANENYKFVGWNPDLITDGELESNTSFTACFEYIATLDDVRNEKIKEFNDICANKITTGQDIELSNGEIVHFDYTDYNQNNLRDIADIAKNTGECVPYYDSSNKCYMLEAIDAVRIYAKCREHISYYLTLDHCLEEMIKKMEDKDTISNLYFSEDCLDDERKFTFTNTIKQLKIAVDKYTQNTVACLG